VAKPAARRRSRKDRPNPLHAAGITYIDYKDTALEWPRRGTPPPFRDPRRVLTCHPDARRP
jgi:hypothetical protein